MRPIVLAALLLLAAPLRAETIAFDVAIAGIKVATLTLQGQVDGGRYAVNGEVKTTRGAGALRRVHYRAEAEGRVAGEDFRPARYAGDVDTGRRQSATRILWQDGLPAVEMEGAIRPGGTPPDPATQKGAVDPLTALFAGMRDRPREGACALRLAVFDGARASRARLSDPQETDGGLTCAGLYTRVAGFTEAEMAERTDFPFTAVFAAQPDGTLRLVELRTVTVFGPAVLRRR